MAIDALLDQLRREASREAAEVEEAAARDAEAVLAAARVDVSTRRQVELARLESARLGVIRRGLAGAEREAASRWLAARSAAVERIFERAGQIVAGLEPARYRDRLAEMVGEAVRYLEPDRAVLSCPPSIESAVRAALGPASPVRIEADPMAPPGVTGRSEDGRVFVDASLPGRLERRRADWSIAVAADLAGATDAPR